MTGVGDYFSAGRGRGIGASDGAVGDAGAAAGSASGAGPEPSVVLIAAADAMLALTASPGFGHDILVFAETDVGRAFNAVIERRPTRVVVHREFLATPRGAALVGRIRSDPRLSHVQIRVLEAVSDYVHLVARQLEAGLQPATAVPGTPHPWDYDGGRAALRLQLRATVDVRIGRERASLVNLSRTGAQLLGPTPLRLNQHVRIQLADDQEVLSLRAAVVWVSFEPSGSQATPAQYRAGVMFIDADAAALEAFCTWNRVAANPVELDEPLEEPPHAAADRAAVQTALADDPGDEARDEARDDARASDRLSRQVRNEW